MTLDAFITDLRSRGARIVYRGNVAFIAGPSAVVDASACHLFEEQLGPVHEFLRLHGPYACGRCNRDVALDDGPPPRDAFVSCANCDAGFVTADRVAQWVLAQFGLPGRVCQN